MDLSPEILSGGLAAFAAVVRLGLSAWDKYDTRRHEREMLRLQMEMQQCVRAVVESEPPPP